MKNQNYFVDFDGCGQNSDSNGSCATFDNAAEAIAFAKAEARDFKNHPDFIGGQFNAWREDDSENVLLFSAPV